MKRNDIGTFLQLISMLFAVVFVFAVFGAVFGSGLLIAVLFVIGTVMQVDEGDV
jgi:hypothetical protein